MSDVIVFMSLLQLQHGLLLANDPKLRAHNPELVMYQKENLLKMQQHLTGATQMPGLMIPPHFHNQFQGFQFRGFPGNFGGGRYPPAVRFHPGFDKQPPFPPPMSPVSPHHHPPPGTGYGLLSPDHNISMR